MADAGRPVPRAVLDDPCPALFALVQLVVELSGADATGQALTMGVSVVGSVSQKRPDKVRTHNGKGSSPGTLDSHLPSLTHHKKT